MTIIASWGAQGANCYVSVTDASSFIMSAIVYSAPWVDASPLQREAALISASRDIDSLQFRGERYFSQQSMEWPRSDLAKWPWNLSVANVNDTLTSYEQDRMKEAVKRACCHQAVFLLQHTSSPNKHLEAIAMGIEGWSETNGPMSESVRYGKGAGQNRSSDMMKLLSPWIGQRRVYRK